MNHAASSRTDPTGLYVETGSDAALLSADRVALIASYSESRTVTKSLARLTQEFVDSGFATVVIRVSDDHSPSEWPGPLPPDVLVLRRENRGYDFGSWADVISAYPDICSASTVALANDSLAGPFDTLRPLLATATSSTADVWGAVSSEQFTPHLQSYFVAFRNGVLTEPALQRFWRQVPRLVDKDEVIDRCELGLSRLLWAEGYSTASLINRVHLARKLANPMIAEWRSVLEGGFPFVKRQLLRQPELAPDSAEIAATVQSLYGENPYDWLPESDRSGVG